MTIARTWISTSLWNALSRGVVVATAFLLNLVLARLMMPADLGIFFLLFSVINTAALLAQMGMRTTVVRNLARAIADANLQDARRALYASLAIFAAGTATSALGVAVGIFGLGSELWSRPHPLGWYAIVCAGWVLTFSVQYFVPETFRAAGDHRSAALFGGLVSSTLSVIALSCLLVAGAVPATVFDVTLVMFAASGINAVFVAKRLGVLMRRYPPIDPRSEIRPTLAQGMPALLGNVAVLLLLQIDLWTIGLLAGPELVAYYGIASRLAVLIGIPAQIAAATVAARLAECGHDRAAMQAVAKTAASISTVPSLLLFVIYLLFGGWMLETLFGAEYRAATGPLIVLAVGHLVTTVFGIAQTTLVMANKQFEVAVAALSVVPFFGVACIVLGYAYGPMGVAVASCGSMLLLAIALWLLAKRLLGVDTLASLHVLWDVARLLRYNRSE